MVSVVFCASKGYESVEWALIGGKTKYSLVVKQLWFKQWYDGSNPSI